MLFKLISICILCTFICNVYVAISAIKSLKKRSIKRKSNTKYTQTTYYINVNNTYFKTLNKYRYIGKTKLYD